LYDDGILSADLRNYKVERITTYFQGGVSNETVWGNIKNMASFALDYDKFKSRDAKVTESDGIIGNVFDGVSVVTAFSEASLDGVTYSYEEVMSATLADRIEYKNVSLYLAGQFRTNEVTSASGDSFDKNAFNPTVAVAYKPVDSVSVYASYAESYTRPLEVSASYDNAGEIFEPIKNKQYEIGVKYKTKKLLNTLSFFDLNEGAYIDQDSDGPMGTIYSQAGENRFKGIEYTVTGKLFDDWNIMGGVTYIDASREKNKKGSEYKNGWESIGVPEYNAAKSQNNWMKCPKIKV
jgi:iron complex outermembrane receptor protein